MTTPLHSFQQIFSTASDAVDALVDCPDRYDRVALVCHPNPLFGGTNKNKVTATIARTLNQHGFCTIRPNFRGVGRSGGRHDRGVGEADDMIELLELIERAYPSKQPITLAGFSFGAFVLARALRQLRAQSRPVGAIILAGVPVTLFDCPSVEGEPLILHGEKDEVIPLAKVLAWSEPQDHPVTVVPGVDHFFSGKLHIVKRVVSQCICGLSAEAE